MPTRRIFISHSTKGEAGLKLLTAVAKRLDDMKYGLLLDRKKLVPGADWYQNVSEWIMACSGAILLLDADGDSGRLRDAGEFRRGLHLDAERRARRLRACRLDHVVVQVPLD